MLIAGCSHAAGSEIDGSEDSAFNRQHTFGNLLAEKMGYRAINIASNGSTNPTIARSVLEWFSKEYKPAEMEVYVCIAWTESSRMELPVERVSWYDHSNPSIDWFSESSREYLRLNQGYPGGNDEERRMMPYYHRFIADHLVYLEIISANLVLQLQYFLQSKNIDYVMCNTMHMFDSKSKHLEFYWDQIDRTKYMGMLDNDNAFFWKYRNAGYINPKAKYWHHGEEPHSMFAEELFNFIEAENVFNQLV